MLRVGALCKLARKHPTGRRYFGMGSLFRMSEGERLPYVAVLECEIRSHLASNRFIAAQVVSKLRDRQDIAVALAFSWCLKPSRIRNVG